MRMAGGWLRSWQRPWVWNPVEKPHGVQMDAIRGGRTHELIIRGQTLPSRWRRLPQVRNGRVICSVGPSGDGEMSMVHILNISQLIATLCEPGGGFLLHAALVCRGDSGFVLTGGSGSGKTTASRRIPSPWRSCCDDYTLVLRDPAGDYWAHPWPTWSRFFQGGPGGSWPVKVAVRLGAIFFLQPAKVDEWSEATPHQPTVKIMEAVEQATVVNRYWVWKNLCCERCAGAVWKTPSSWRRWFLPFFYSLLCTENFGRPWKMLWPLKSADRFFACRGVN